MVWSLLEGRSAEPLQGKKPYQRGTKSEPGGRTMPDRMSSISCTVGRNSNCKNPSPGVADQDRKVKAMHSKICVMRCKSKNMHKIVSLIHIVRLVELSVCHDAEVNQNDDNRQMIINWLKEQK